MLRWRFFEVYAAITLVLILLCFSDFFFGDGKAKQLAIRLMFCFLWPIAALSSTGREILFKQGRGL